MSTEDIQRLLEICADLTAKVQYLVDRLETEEGVFTFPDGDSWCQGEPHDKLQ